MSYDQLPIDEMTKLLFVAAAVPVMGAAYLLNKGHGKAVVTGRTSANPTGRTSANPNGPMRGLDWYG